MGKNSAIVLGAALLALSGVVHATNPCDFDEKACETWNKYLAAQQAWQESRAQREKTMTLPPRYTGNDNTCPDGKELDGKAIEATVTFKETGKAVTVKMTPASCAVEYPREEPEGTPYTVRAYRSGDGGGMSVYSSADRPTSTMSLRLDGADSASLIPAFRNSALASGKDVDLGEVLLVKLDQAGQNGKVIAVRLTIRSSAP